MRRSHLLWSPLQPGGSPRWPMTDAYNCCPWLNCSPLSSSKKKKLWINLCFQTCFSPPRPPAVSSPDIIYVPPSSVSSVLAILYHFLLYEQQKCSACLIFPCLFSQHPLLFWLKREVLSPFFCHTKGILAVWQTHCVQRERHNVIVHIQDYNCSIFLFF